MSEATKTLVLLSPAFAENESDSWLPGQEAFVLALNRHFTALKITILTFHFPLVATKSYSWFGNEVIAFNGGMKGKWHSLKLWNQVWKKLRALQQEKNLLGIFSFFCSECAFIGHYFARKHRLQHYIWILGQDARAGNKQVKRIHPAAGELVAISDFLVREFESNHKVKPAHMIPIGIYPGSYPKAPMERDIDLLGVGSLIPLKQYTVFIDVVKELKRTMPHIQARICGDGPELEKLQSKIQELQLQDNISLCGKLTPAEVIGLMQRSKILLHPSAYEGFGMVCAEALYAGAQVISFCKPMDRDIEHWHIVADQEQMLAKTLALLQQPALEQTRVMTFSMEQTARAIMGLFAYSETITS